MATDISEMGRLIAAAHIGLLKPDTTAAQAASAAEQAAEAVVMLLGLDDGDDAPRVPFAAGSTVHTPDRGRRGIVLSTSSTDGEMHTVLVRWRPDTMPDYTMAHHPSELVQDDA